jgi:mannose-6-phosphate isomerase-like protein (cupin superfamily)
VTLSSGGYALGGDAGEAIWFLGTRMTVKAGTDQTSGAFTLIECECPPGFAPPPHVHHVEDEAFYLLEGTLRVNCDDHTWQLNPGGFVFLPKGRRHRFVVEGDHSARLLQITAPAQFERFASDVGVPATRPGLPDPEAPDLDRLLAAAAAYHIDILYSDDT